MGESAGDLAIAREDPARAFERFSALATRDQERMAFPKSWLSWLFVDRLYARKERLGMNFYGFDGREHVGKYFNWIAHTPYPDYLASPRRDALIETSFQRDQQALARLGLPSAEKAQRNVSVYNAQDYMLQRLYPTPDSQRPRRILDFGAGHGRAANLAFGAADAETELMVSVDGIPGSYLTQRVYYEALGLKVSDYLDRTGADGSYAFEAEAAAHQLLHIPTWRMDLLPPDYFDMVVCVQVLKELPRRLLCHVVKEFGRIVKPGGAVYVRDHLQFHDPNNMPIDDLLSTSGFVLEFRPRVRDREALHGVPRIWRKFDANLFLGAED